MRPLCDLIPAAFPIAYVFYLKTFVTENHVLPDEIKPCLTIYWKGILNVLMERFIERFSNACWLMVSVLVGFLFGSKRWWVTTRPLGNKQEIGVMLSSATKCGISFSLSHAISFSNELLIYLFYALIICFPVGRPQGHPWEPRENSTVLVSLFSPRVRGVV